MDKAKKSVPTKKKSVESVPAMDKTEESVPATDKTEESVPAKEKAKKSVPTKEKAKKSVPTKKKTEESVPAKDKTEESVPAKDKTEESVPTKKKTEESVPAKEKAKKSVPTKKKSVAAAAKEAGDEWVPSRKMKRDKQNVKIATRRRKQCSDYSNDHWLPPSGSEKKTVALADDVVYRGTLPKEVLNHPELTVPSGELYVQYRQRWALVEAHAQKEPTIARQYRINLRQITELGHAFMSYGAFDFYKKFNVQKKTFEHLVYMAEAVSRDDKGKLLKGHDANHGDFMSLRMLGLLWLLQGGGRPSMVPFLNGQKARDEIEIAVDLILKTCPFMECPDENEQLAAEALAYEYSYSVGLPVEGAICCLDSTTLIDAGERDEDGYRSGEAWLACRADGYVYSGDYFEGHNTKMSVKSLRMYKTTLHNEKGGLVTFNSRHSTKTIPAFATVDSDGDMADSYKDERHIASGAPFKSAHRLHISTADHVYNISKTKLQMGTVETQIGKLKQKWHLLQSWGSLANLGYNLRRKIWLCALLITNLDYKAEFDAGRKRVEEEGRLTTIASTSTPQVARTAITRALPQLNKVVPPRRITKSNK